MEQLSALDSVFLHAESPQASLHIASVAFFEGPEPEYAAIVRAIGAKLPQVPRWRQRLRRIPLDLGRPVWVDDEHFDLDEHVQHLEVPSPGGAKELHEVVDRVMSEPLELKRPLWEVCVLSDLEGGRWGLVIKAHHSMVDGIAGTDLLTTLLDHAPAVPPGASLDGAAAGEGEPWAPAPDPPAVRLVGATLRSVARARVREVRGIGPSLALMTAHPKATLARTLGLGHGLLGFAGAAAPTSASPLIGPLGRDRLYRWTSLSLTDLWTVKQHFGVTVNDVVLAGLGNGLRELLLAREVDLTHHHVRTLVPVSVRHEDQRGIPDNRVSAILLDLPVEIGEARDRLVETSVRMRRLKKAQEAAAGELLAELGDATPAPLLSAGLHLFFKLPHRHLSTVATNVPGPVEPLYLLGRRLDSAYPYVPLADRVRLGTAVTSYDGRLLVGVTADRDHVPDVDVVIDGIDRGFAELLDAVEPPRPGPPGQER